MSRARIRRPDAGAGSAPPGLAIAACLALLASACGLSAFPYADAQPAVIDAGAVLPPPDAGPAPRPPDARGSDARGTGPGAADAAAPGGQRDAARDQAPAEPPPVTGDGLVIGGVARPKEKVVVFIHIGHSNMAGRTNTPAELRAFNFETDPRLWVYAMGAFAPAREPLSGDFLTRGRAGPGMSILRTGMTFSPDAVMVSIGKGQDGSRGGACKAFRRGGLLYDAVMGPAKALRGKVTFGGIFSMLVLMEIYDKPNLMRSHECMEGVARDMREDLGDPAIPFVMSDWEAGATGRFDPDLPDATLARAQLRIAQQNIARSVIVPTDGLPMSDDHHFDLTGYKMWAERAFAAMNEAGWLTWAADAARP
jgi:hypothetical protein